MPPLIYTYIVFAWLLMNAVAIAITCADKLAAKKHRRRIPESTLLWVAVLGGGMAMYLTMLLIRHKTQKVKFMVGIPAILLIEAAVVIALRCADSLHF